MKKAIILACAAVILSGLSACEEPRHHKQVNKYVKTVKLTHMSDGSWARYDDTNDIWFWYYITNSNNANATYTGAVFNGGGYWKTGSAPTTSQRTGAVEEEEEVQTDVEGNPISEEELQEFQTEEQAVEAETETTGQTETDNTNGNDGNDGNGGDNGGGDAGGDSGGGDGGGGGE